LILAIFFVFGFAFISATNQHGNRHQRREVNRRNRQNGCVFNDAKQSLVCRCSSEVGQESWQIPNIDGFSIRRIYVHCCTETQPLDLGGFLNRVGNFRGTVRVKGGCCYNGRIPEQISVTGAENCEKSVEYVDGEKLVQAVEPMMADSPATYNENDGDVVEDVVVNEIGVDSDDEMQRNNRRRNRNRTRPLSAACDVSGLWYNEHGSELYLQQSRHGHLTGEFRTAVEVECGSAGRNYSTVHGTIVGQLFSFHVHWDTKKSVTTWVGQCHESCDHGFLPIGAEPMLHSTWVLTSETNDCNDAWNQNRIGQNVFARRQLKKGPRKLDGTNGPVRND